MRKVSFIVATFLFVLIFALPLVAQTGGAQPAANKIGIINTEAFYDDKAGITRLMAAYAALNKEFEPRQQELITINNRVEALAKEIQTLQGQLNTASTNPQVKVDVAAIQNTIATKSDEGARLQLDFKRRQEDAKAALDKREAAVVGPIRREIGNAVTEYAKSRGFSLVLDGAKMDQAGQLLFIDQSIDLTAEFIKFFNAKPATTASATTPATKPPATKPN